MLTYVAGHEVNKIRRLLMMSEVIEPMRKMEVFSFIFFCLYVVYLLLFHSSYLLVHAFSLHIFVLNGCCILNNVPLLLCTFLYCSGLLHHIFFTEYISCIDTETFEFSARVTFITAIM